MASSGKPLPIAPQTMTLTLLWGLAFKLLLPLLVLIAVVNVLTQTQTQRIRRLSRAGWSQRRIAERLNLSRYRVRQALA